MLVPIIMFSAFAVLIVITLTVIFPLVKKKDKELYERMKNGTSKELEQYQFLQSLKESVNKTSEKTNSISYCDYCGSEIEDDSKTCPSCGAKTRKK